MKISVMKSVLNLSLLLIVGSAYAQTPTPAASGSSALVRPQLTFGDDVSEAGSEDIAKCVSCRGPNGSGRPLSFGANNASLVNNWLNKNYPLNSKGVPGVE